MREGRGRVAESARVTLAGIRLLNGTAALLAPSGFGRRLGVDPETNRAAVYVLRLFGVRTILLGVDLLHRDPGVRGRALRVGPLVHVSDAAAAAVAGVAGQLPARAARTAAVISTANVVLSLLARRGALTG